MSRAKRRRPSRADRLARPAEPHSAILDLPVTRPATEHDIRVRAYHLWEADGRPQGDGVAYWLRAERELC